MSKMNELDLCISDIANGDEKLRQSMIEEITDHLNGTTPWNQLSRESQMAYEIFESDMGAEVTYGNRYVLLLMLLIAMMLCVGNANAYPHSHSTHSHSSSIKIPKSWR